jgi:hypothetical protein
MKRLVLAMLMLFFMTGAASVDGAPVSEFKGG